MYIAVFIVAFIFGWFASDFTEDIGQALILVGLFILYGLLISLT